MSLTNVYQLYTPPIDKQSGVIFTLVTQQVDEWYEYLLGRGLEFEKPPTKNELYRPYFGGLTAKI